MHTSQHFADPSEFCSVPRYILYNAKLRLASRISATEYYNGTGGGGGGGSAYLNSPMWSFPSEALAFLCVWLDWCWGSMGAQKKPGNIEHAQFSRWRGSVWPSYSFCSPLWLQGATVAASFEVRWRWRSSKTLPGFADWRERSDSRVWPASSAR